MSKVTMACAGAVIVGAILLSGCCAVPHALSMFSKDKDKSNGCMMGMSGHGDHAATQPASPDDPAAHETPESPE